MALNLTKYAHNVNQRRAEPLPYTCLPLWWLGLAFTIVGEVGNFAAYGFAETSMIAPLGAVSVLANAFIAAFVLGEGLRLRDVLGCALCVAGGLVIVKSTPVHSVELDPDAFVRSLSATPFILYIVVLTIVVGIMLGFQDTYGGRHVVYYVLLCSLLGSVTVMSCKGVSTFLNLWACCGAPSPFTQPVMYMLMLVLGSTAILQVRYLNEAMERFGNTETVPVYYVLFTLSTISGANVLYRDFENEDRWTVLSFCGGGCLCVTRAPCVLRSAMRMRMRCAVGQHCDAGFTPSHAHPGSHHAQLPSCAMAHLSRIAAHRAAMQSPMRIRPRRSFPVTSTGCLLTFLGVKLLTSRRRRGSMVSMSADDEKRAPMLANAHPCGASAGMGEPPSFPPPLPPSAAGATAAMLPDEPPLDRLFLNPRHSGSAADPYDDHYDEEEQPLSLVAGSTIGGLSGEVLRRTFSSRLATFNERAGFAESAHVPGHSPSRSAFN